MKMRKLISLVLALVMVLGLAVPAMAAAESVQETAGGRLLSLGVIEGYTDGTLGLDKTITRAEIAVVLARITGMGDAADLLKDTPSKFSDVKTGEWYTGWINLASSQGWVVGDPQGTFRPNDSISYREIVTVLLKVLGYDDNLPGDWPTNFLAKAAALGITKDIVSDSKAPAVRGDVFIMTSRTLDEKVVSYDKETGKFVFNKDEETLLVAKMGLEKVEGVVTDIPRLGTKDDQIRITGKNGGLFDVVGNVDYEAIFGCEVTAWLNDDGDVVFVDIESDEVFFDAIEWNYSKKELKLVDVDDKYDLAKDVVIYIDGVEKDFSNKENQKFDYAKVVLDEDGDVVFIDAWTWDGFIAVEEVDDDVVYGYDDELDIEDFTIVKGGKTVTADDLAEGDILFFNEAKDYAEVYTVSVTGVIERVYKESFEVDGEEFEGYVYGAAEHKTQYVDGDKLKDFGEDEAADMKDEGKDAIVYVDRFGNAVLVIGDTGAAKTSSFYGYVIYSAKGENRRGEEYIKVDIVNEAGKVVAYDVDPDDIKGTLRRDIKIGNTGVVVEVEVDEDGEVDTLTVLEPAANVTETFKTDAKYVAGKRLQDSAIVFDVEDYDGKDPADEDDIVVSTFGELKYDEIDKADIYVNDSDRVVVILAFKTSRSDDVKEYKAVATANARKITGEKTWRLELNIDGEVKTYLTEEDADVLDGLTVSKGDFLLVDIHNVSGEIIDVDKVTSGDLYYDSGVVASRSVSDSTITLEGGKIYRLSDAVILDEDLDPISIRTISVGDSVKLFLAANESSYVAYAIVFEEETPDDNDDEPETITYIVDYYNEVFGRLDLEDRNGDKLSLFVEDFAGFELNGKKVEIEAMKTVLESLEPGKTIVVTEDNVLIVEGEIIEVESEEADALKNAIEDAKPGDTIMIASGSYDIGTTRITEPISIIGENGTKINGVIAVESDGKKGTTLFKNLEFTEVSKPIQIGTEDGQILDEIVIDGVVFAGHETTKYRTISPSGDFKDLVINKLTIKNSKFGTSLAIYLTGDIGTLDISDNEFIIPRTHWGTWYSAVNINQGIDARESINPSGTYTVAGNTIILPEGADPESYAGVICNQRYPAVADRVVEGKALDASGNTLKISGEATITDGFINDTFQ